MNRKIKNNSKWMISIVESHFFDFSLKRINIVCSANSMFILRFSHSQYYSYFIHNAEFSTSNVESLCTNSCPPQCRKIQYKVDSG